VDYYILENIRIQNKDYLENPAEIHKRTKGFHQLTDNEKDVFRRLYFIRDKYAQLINMASHNLINNKYLLSMAKNEVLPTDLRFPKRMDRKIIPEILKELKGELKAANCT